MLEISSEWSFLPPSMAVRSEWLMGHNLMSRIISCDMRHRFNLDGELLSFQLLGSESPSVPERLDHPIR